LTDCKTRVAFAQLANPGLWRHDARDGAGRCGVPPPALSPSVSDAVFEIGMLSDLGGGWPGNEDACARCQLTDGELLVAVADGGGGNGGGDVASRLAIDTTTRLYRAGPPGRDPGKFLTQAVRHANIAIHDDGLATPALSGMATTLTAAIIRSDSLWAVHVGDTRLYLVRGDSIRSLTRDHHVASAPVRLRLQGAESARRNPERSPLTRPLGASLVPSVDRISSSIEPGDRIVLCTDGIHTLVADQEILGYCTGQTARMACRSVVAAAKRRNPTDNLTVAVVAVNDVSHSAPYGWRSRLSRLLDLVI